MNRLPIFLVLVLVATGCANLNDGKSLTQEVTSPPSPAFMKKVAGDPFPAAGAPAVGPKAPSGGGNSSGQAPRGGGSMSSQSGSVQFGPAHPSGTGRKGLPAVR